MRDHGWHPVSSRRRCCGIAAPEGASICPSNRVHGRDYRGCIDDRSQPFIALSLVLAAVAVTLAACGAGKKVVSGPVTVTGTTTISGVRAGVLIKCRGGPAARVPHWFGPSYLRLPGVPGVIELRHRHGSVIVSCRR
jgi:hypothetical protein